MWYPGGGGVAASGRNLELELTERTAAWVSRHGDLKDVLAEALSRAADADAEEPLAFLAAHFAREARAASHTESDVRAVLKLQRLVRGILSNKVGWLVD
jgi:hypothetical protein